MSEPDMDLIYLGLDIGAGSVGWAVTNAAYGLLRCKGKDMWGVRLFDEAKTAADRRAARVQRRRIQRKKQRLELLQHIFRAEIEKTDPAFFQRMASARLLPEDKVWKHTLFHEAGYTDKQYHAQYPTIYHLRRALMEEDGPFDVRLVYLAIHHILKKRGHFLYADPGGGRLPAFGEIFDEAEQMLADELGIDLACNDRDELARLLMNPVMKLTEKQKKVNALLKAGEKIEKEWGKALCGGSAKLSVLFNEPALEESNFRTVEFRKAGYEDHIAELEELLGERFVILEKWRSVYNWGVLQRLLDGKASLSEAKICQYEQYGDDLRRLKVAIRKYGTKAQYHRIFRDVNIGENYAHYTGAVWEQGKKINLSRCTHAAFCSFIKKELDQIGDAPEVAALREKAEKQTLMPRLASGENSVIPCQLHRMELEQILKKAAVYLPFLTVPDEEGLTPEKKIRMLFAFRIPYYVGPLCAGSEHSWFVRKEDGAILPWNFERKVDMGASAQKFIDRMTAQCSYLRGCDVLPACSPSYERYKALNEINPMTVGGEPISVELKQEIFEHVFMREKNPTLAKIIRFLNTKGIRVGKEDIAGLDVEGGVKSNMKTTIALRTALGGDYSDALAEKIALLLTYFGDDPKMLREKLREIPSLSAAAIRSIMNIRCTGWGRLSAELLHEIGCDMPDGQGWMSLLDALYQTNETLMGLLSERYAFQDAIDARNREQGEESMYEFIDELHVSPPVRRQIRQTMAVVLELRKALGRDPAKVFVEMARGGEARKERKPERKHTLMAGYEALKDEYPALYGELERTGNQDLRRDSLYLYFTQLGRCMYTGEPIDLAQLLSGEKLYDIDHIYPRSRVKDDSIDNRVLVKQTVNRGKTNRYPLDAQIVAKQGGYWQMLLKKGLISKKKYERLTRRTGFTIDELTQFTNRQLVETRQSTRAIAQLLKRLMPESEIVYVKAGIVSDFRRARKMLKVREVNDLHHARDAYLNIVAGNIYNTEFTHSPHAYIRKNPDNYTIDCESLLKRRIARDGVVAWNPGDDGSIVTVRKMMAKNTPLVTVMAVIEGGKLFNVMPMKKGSGQMRLKKNLPTEKYGRYTDVKGAAFMLVEHTKKKERVRSLIDVPLYLYPEIVKKPESALRYCAEVRKLDDPKVVLPLIRKNSLLCLDGYRVYITGRTGDRLAVMKANQLILAYAWEEYIKKMIKALNESKEYMDKNGVQAYRINPNDGIDAEKNLALYDLLVEKMEKGAFCTQLRDQHDKLLLARGQFARLNVLDQCHALRQILNIFARKGQYASLECIGLTKNFGVVRPNNCISDRKSALLIHQSPTGLFEKVVDLKTI